MIRKADINDDPDHYTIRARLAKAGDPAEVIAGIIWKEYR